ncbi:GntR family transcriptional regulator [Phreatobacter stygius]|uniref:GntR family transcriptional regulator n=1 Tax=Phreatobacter stygius TaxID=1940610 RepID=A0A4D7BGS3_9HYPH|nr:GntR family transcriptional regulator [Phreatobacter stygius]QCI67062.1 GntR family transcriptional regulator [Phreatobacter stygius]
MIASTLEALGPPVLVRDRAFEQVWDAIISGRIQPGTRLIERELCDAMGISRASVREVIRRLEAERLVTVEPRRGPTVVTLTPEQASEIYEIRAMLESLVIRRFTERAGLADIATLEAIFAEMTRAAGAEDVPRIVLLVHRFNDHLLAVAGHGTAGDMLAHLDARISWLRVKAMAVPGRLRTSIDEMGAVLQAVRSGDADAAAALITKTVFNARDAAVAEMTRSGVPAKPPAKPRKRQDKR